MLNIIENIVWQSVGGGGGGKFTRRLIFILFFLFFKKTYMRVSANIQIHDGCYRNEEKKTWN